MKKYDTKIKCMPGKNLEAHLSYFKPSKRLNADEGLENNYIITHYCDIPISIVN